MQRFNQLWHIASQFEGWLSHDQAVRLWRCAEGIPATGLIVEIGSHHGKSTSILAAAAQSCQVVAIDPFDNPRWGGGPASRTQFVENLKQAGVTNVELVADVSTAVRPGWSTPIDMLYIDGAHDFATVMDDLEWSEWIRPEGRVLLHDAFSSKGVTLALLRRLVTSRDLDYVGRTGSLAEFKKAPRTVKGLALALGEMPWLARNVAVKICIRRDWRRGARLLGQPDMSMPY